MWDYLGGRCEWGPDLGLKGVGEGGRRGRESERRRDVSLLSCCFREAWDSAKGTREGKWDARSRTQREGGEDGVASSAMG